MQQLMKQREKLFQVTCTAVPTWAVRPRHFRPTAPHEASAMQQNCVYRTQGNHHSEFVYSTSIITATGLPGHRVPILSMVATGGSTVSGFAEAQFLMYCSRILALGPSSISMAITGINDSASVASYHEARFCAEQNQIMQCLYISFTLLHADKLNNKQIAPSPSEPRYRQLPPAKVVW